MQSSNTGTGQRDRNAVFGKLLGWCSIRLPAIAGIILFVLVCRHGDRASTCASDFANFYIGARLAFSGQVYAPPSEMRILHEILGCNGEFYQQFVRLPYLAVLLWPLAQLPFSLALIVWRCFCVASAFAFVCLWPGERWRTLTVLSCSFPLMAAFAYGQDVPILLLVFGVSILLLSRGHDFAAGLCLSLGAAKPHIFGIVVLVILLRRCWRMLKGFGVGQSGLLALSFMGGGFRWPLDFWRTVSGPWINPNPERMINLHGFVYTYHLSTWFEAITAIAFLALIIKACMRVPAAIAFSLALGSGVLVGGHSYLYDLAFSIPLLLLLLESGSVPLWVKWYGWIFALPVIYVLSPSPFSSLLVHLALILFLVPVAVLLCRPAVWTLLNAEFAGSFLLRREGNWRMSEEVGISQASVCRLT